MLGKCEQFFLELMNVPRVESKLRVFTFRITFSSQVSDLRCNLNTINAAAREVKESTKLRQVMQTILTLGNALNQGTARESNFLIAEKMPELLDFDKDFVHLEATSKILLKSLAEEMQAVSKGLEKVEQEHTASENDGAISAGFQKVGDILGTLAKNQYSTFQALKNFLDTAEAEGSCLVKFPDTFILLGRSADSLSQYFGEDPARCPCEQGLVLFSTFMYLIFCCCQVWKFTTFLLICHKDYVRDVSGCRLD
ncbi:hypothetical protein HYC85_026156 [Camellia sinensis]|uniref:FH2 domain-containing protein n=1 Tax=Camellia sinensis TaxID=4442 RepID=A0A7J7G3D0_CAMSI|nr:hypothetical protein HYC85_026156 [Camellia sinensis]